MAPENAAAALTLEGTGGIKPIRVEVSNPLGEVAVPGASQAYAPGAGPAWPGVPGWTAPGLAAPGLAAPGEVPGGAAVLVAPGEATVTGAAGPGPTEVVPPALSSAGQGVPGVPGASGTPGTPGGIAVHPGPGAAPSAPPGGGGASAPPGAETGHGALAGPRRILPAPERAHERSEPVAVHPAAPSSGASPDELHRLVATAVTRSQARTDDDRGPSGESGDRKPTRIAGPLNTAARAIVARFAANEGSDRQPATITRWVGEAAEPRRPAGGSPGTPAVAQVAVPAPAPAAATGIAGTMAVSAMAGRPAMELDRATDLQSQIVQAMRVQLNGNGGDARIRLQPAYLGELTISLRVEHGAVVAHLATSTPDVRQWIETNEATLRQGLAQHDLKLERLVVVDDEPASGSDREAAPGDREERQPPRRRRRPAEDATFEVVV